MTPDVKCIERFQGFRFFTRADVCRCVHMFVINHLTFLMENIFETSSHQTILLISCLNPSCSCSIGKGFRCKLSDSLSKVLDSGHYPPNENTIFSSQLKNCNLFVLAKHGITKLCVMFMQIHIVQIFDCLIHRSGPGWLATISMVDDTTES